MIRPRGHAFLGEKPLGMSAASFSPYKHLNEAEKLNSSAGPIFFQCKKWLHLVTFCRRFYSYLNGKKNEKKTEL